MAAIERASPSLKRAEEYANLMQPSLHSSASLLDQWLVWIEAHPGLASWVQALGTVAALLLAIALPYLERRATERAAARRCWPYVKAVRNAVTDIQCYYEDQIPRNSHDTPRREQLHAEVRSAIDRLNAQALEKLSNSLALELDALTNDALWIAFQLTNPGATVDVAQRMSASQFRRINARMQRLNNLEPALSARAPPMDSDDA